MEKHKTFRGDGEFVKLVGMEDLCRKNQVRKIKYSQIGEGLGIYSFYCFALFIYVFVYFLNAVEKNG